MKIKANWSKGRTWSCTFLTNAFHLGGGSGNRAIRGSWKRLPIVKLPFFLDQKFFINFFPTPIEPFNIIAMFAPTWAVRVILFATKIRPVDQKWKIFLATAWYWNTLGCKIFSNSFTRRADQLIRMKRTQVLRLHLQNRLETRDEN